MLARRGAFGFAVPVAQPRVIGVEHAAAAHAPARGIRVPKAHARLYSHPVQ